MDSCSLQFLNAQNLKGAHHETWEFLSQKKKILPRNPKTQITEDDDVIENAQYLYNTATKPSIDS